MRVAGRTFEFRGGETIHTENSYKYTPESFDAMARGSGWTPVAAWTDPNGYFAVQALTVTAACMLIVYRSSTRSTVQSSRFQVADEPDLGAARPRVDLPAQVVGHPHHRHPGGAAGLAAAIDRDAAGLVAALSGHHADQ